MTHLWLLIPILILVFLSGQFSAAETAYSSASKIRLRTMAGEGNKRARNALKLLDRFDSVLSTVLIGSNIANITLTTLSTLMFVQMFVGDEAIGTVISTAATTLVVLAFGEITPKMLARNNPEGWAMAYYGFVVVCEVIIYPLNMAFKAWKALLTKMFKLKKTQGITEEELVTIVEAAEDEGGLNVHESTLIKNAIEFDDLEVRDIMVPRVSVLAFQDNAPPAEVAGMFRDSGFSRLPVYHNTVDSIIGFVHEKDFNNLYYGGRYSDAPAEINYIQIVKPTACVSPSMKVSLVLRILQRKKQHLAIVVDEFGGTAGIVTMEDILEELVGEIWDEHDEVEELFRAQGGDDYTVNGFANIDDVLERLGAREKDFDATTVGGWVIELVGAIPPVGAKLGYDNLEITVLKANARRVLEVKIHVMPRIDTDEDDD